MTPQTKDNITTVVSIIDEARSSALAIVGKDPELSSIKLRINHSLLTLSNSIKAMVGLSPDMQDEKIVFPPIDKIDGEYIKTPEVKAEDLTPSVSDTETLRERVLQLEKGLLGMTDEEIIRAYKTDSDILVIRGLAKKAGIADYQEATIDEKLIAGTREKLAAKKTQTAGDKTAIIAQIKAAETKEQVEELAKGNDDEEIQNAALEKIIELEG